SALDHRHLRVLWLHPAYERRCHRSLYTSEGWHARGGVAGQAAGDGGRDAACTARWCIGAAQRSVGNERPARSASLRHGAVRNIQLFVTAPLTPFGLPRLAALDAQLRQEAIWCLLREALCSPDEPRPAE